MTRPYREWDGCGTGVADRPRKFHEHGTAGLGRLWNSRVTLGHVRTRDLETLAVLRERVASGAVRRIREGAGISRTELASTVGVSLGALTKWELRMRVPTGPAALRYARALERLAAVRETP